MTDDQHDNIVRRRVRRIAQEHGVTLADVEKALDRHPAEPGNYLKRTLALELVELQGIFHEKAVTESDPVSGALCVKIAERRATLLGLSPPQGHAVTIISQPGRHSDRESSIAAHKRAFAHVLGKRLPPPAVADDDDNGAAH